MLEGLQIKMEQLNYRNKLKKYSAEEEFELAKRVIYSNAFMNMMTLSLAVDKIRIDGDNNEN